MAGSVDVVPLRSKRIRNLRNNLESNSKSNAASERFMSIVTDDILCEILVRLPHAKYVIRCSLVSKRWQSLIRHPQFAAEFFRQNPRRIQGNNFELFFRIGRPGLPGPRSVYKLYSEKESETNRFYPNLGGRQPWPDIKLRSSSLDLMVFKNGYKNEIHVCNPLTWQWLKIPDPIPSLRTLSYTGIVTDLKNFGHYKVVAVDEEVLDNPFADGGMLDIHVFCSRSRIWTHSRFSVPYMEFEIHNAISNQGVLYYPFGEYDLIIGVLVCSPLESSRCRWVGRPVEGFLGGSRAATAKVFFGVVSGRLRVSQFLKRKSVFSLKIWELRYDESEFESDYSWVLVHDVSLRSGNNDKTKMFVVAFHPYNGDVIFMLRDRIDICKYHNIREDKYEIVGQLPISNLIHLRAIKDNFTYYVKAFTVVHNSWPTPVGHKLS